MGIARCDNISVGAATTTGCTRRRARSSPRSPCHVTSCNRLPLSAPATSLTPSNHTTTVPGSGPSRDWDGRRAISDGRRAISDGLRSLVTTGGAVSHSVRSVAAVELHPIRLPLPLPCTWCRRIGSRNHAGQPQSLAHAALDACADGEAQRRPAVEARQAPHRSRERMASRMAELRQKSALRAKGMAEKHAARMRELKEQEEEVVRQSPARSSRGSPAEGRK